MTTKTTEDVLTEIRRRMDELEARADEGAAQAQAAFRGRLLLLREEESAARAAVREQAEAVDERLRQLELDIAIAEDRLASDMARDASSFAEAVESELEEWDAAIERLQMRAATLTQRARADAETVIAELRRARNRVTEQVTALRASSHDAWQATRDRVAHAIDDLERRVREAAARDY